MNSAISKASSVLSFILHPFMIPTYATILFMYGSSAFSFLPLSVRQMITVNIIINTLVIPALAIYLLYRMGHLPNLGLKDRRSRVLPIIIVTICYGLAMYMMEDVMMIYVVRKFMLTAILALGCVFAVNFWWKISLHLTAMGGFVAMIFILNISKLMYSPLTLALAILMAGLLASARLQLGRHTPKQITAGFSCGFIVCMVTMLFL